MPALTAELESVTFTPRGIIRSDHRDTRETPIQATCAQHCRGRVEVFEA